jgi:hypothetical protein
MRLGDQALPAWPPKGVSRIGARARTKPNISRWRGRTSGKREKAGQGAEMHRTDSGTMMGVSTAELMLLAPRLRVYLKTPTPA